MVHVGSEPALTRSQWFAAADRLLAALEPFRSASGALVELPGRPSWSGPRSDALEGFARSFLLTAFRVAGAAGEDPAGLLERTRSGLLAGTDPAHPDAWPAIVDRGQALVEAASLVIGLNLTRPWLWERLESAEQEQVAAWLAPSARVTTPDNNWVLFRVMVQEFLAGAGFAFDESVIDAGLDRIDDWYDGDGWYRDGDGQNFDYYNAWAMHVYPHLWADMHRRRDAARAREAKARYRERLSAFLPQHVRFFGGDGMPIFQGRSLAYRFAALAPIWLGELEGVSPLAPGATRRLTSRIIRRFTEGGALDERGILTNGWLGPFPPMVQPYSGPASPYWASKGFLGLLLPADSPVWTDEEQPTPLEESNDSLLLAAPGFLVQTSRDDGIARIVNHGSDHHPPLVGTDDPHYGRLAYSSATAPSFDPHPVDNHVALIDEQGRSSRRGAIERLPAAAGALASAHALLGGAGRRHSRDRDRHPDRDHLGRARRDDRAPSPRDERRAARASDPVRRIRDRVGTPARCDRHRHALVRMGGRAHLLHRGARGRDDDGHPPCRRHEPARCAYGRAHPHEPPLHGAQRASRRHPARRRRCDRRTTSRRGLVGRGTTHR